LFRILFRLIVQSTCLHFRHVFRTARDTICLANAIAASEHMSEAEMNQVSTLKSFFFFVTDVAAKRRRRFVSDKFRSDVFNACKSGVYPSLTLLADIRLARSKHVGDEHIAYFVLVCQLSGVYILEVRQAGNPYRMGRISTVELLVITSSYEWSIL